MVGVQPLFQEPGAKFQNRTSRRGFDYFEIESAVTGAMSESISWMISRANPLAQPSSNVFFYRSAGFRLRMTRRIADFDQFFHQVLEVLVLLHLCSSALNRMIRNAIGHGLAFDFAGENPHRMSGITWLGTVAVGFAALAFVMGQVAGTKIADIGEPLAQCISLGGELLKV